MCRLHNTRNSNLSSYIQENVEGVAKQTQEKLWPVQHGNGPRTPDMIKNEDCTRTTQIPLTTRSICKKYHQSRCMWVSSSGRGVNVNEFARSSTRIILTRREENHVEFVIPLPLVGKAGVLCSSGLGWKYWISHLVLHHPRNRRLGSCTQWRAGVSSKTPVIAFAGFERY